MTDKAKYLELYWQLNAYISSELEKLYKEYTIALNIGCSSWAQTLAGLQPVKIDNVKAELAHKNMCLIQDELLYKKYLLVCAFKDIVGHDICDDNYKYWREKDVNSSSSSC